jgi:hypothetical protein
MRAKKHGTDTLTYEEFVEFMAVNECYYCGDAIDRNAQSYAYFLDRKSNDIGYTKDNCVVCCSPCNYIKSNMNSDEFINFCKKVANNRTQYDANN